MAKAMIFSVGGSSEPIIKSLVFNHPRFVSFLVSKNSNFKLGEIVKACLEQGVSFDSHEALVSHPDNVVSCFTAAISTVEQVKAAGYKSEDVVLDFTGGTKPMSAALVLAGTSKGFKFSYVGGDKRDKGGLGAVCSGSEQFVQVSDPWDLFDIEERRNISLLFNRYQFAAAKVICSQLSKKNSINAVQYIRLVRLLDGFDRWDRFLHKRAKSSFDKPALAKLLESEDIKIRDFAVATKLQLIYLENCLNEEQSEGRALIVDLLSNAERRYAERKIPDALLRLYRAVEMFAQYRLKFRYNINYDDITLDKIPVISRSWVNAPNGRVTSLGLSKCYRLLFDFGDEVGVFYNRHRQLFSKFQKDRNDSFLAHGKSSAGPSEYEEFRRLVWNLGKVTERELIVFPFLDL